MNGCRDVPVRLAPASGCCALGPGHRHADSRHHVQLGGTVTLNVRIEGARGSVAMPTWRALRQDSQSAA